MSKHDPLMRDSSKHDSSKHDPLRLQLASLAEADPPEQLWAQLDGARRRRTRRWQWAAGGAAMLALALGLLPLRPFTHSTQEPGRERIAVHEPVGAAPAEPAADPDGAGPDGADPDGSGARLRALDRELQAAYRGNASDAELAELWITRRALLASRNGEPVKPLRI